MNFTDKKNINSYINYLIVAYAFSFPISKAMVNILELLLILLWVYQGDWKHKYEMLKSNKFMISLAAFMLLYIVNIPFASSTPFALQYLAKYHHFLIVPIIYTSLEKKYIGYIFSAFIASMFISELMSYGIYFNLFTYKHATHEFPTPFMHHITYSVVSAFTSTILLTNVFTVKELRYKIFNGIFFITMVMNLFINGGRTGQVVFVVLIFVLSMMYIKHKMKAILLASSIIFITFFGAYNFSDNFSSRIDQFENGIAKMINNDDYTGQGGMRAAMWIVGSEVFAHNFFTGTGIGNAMRDANYYASLHSFKTRDMNEFADYHNVFINISAQLGIVGLLILLFMLYSLFKLRFETQQYRVLSVIFVISFILFSCTHNTIHIMNPMIYFVLFASLFSGISRLEKKSVSV